MLVVAVFLVRNGHARTFTVGYLSREPDEQQEVVTAINIAIDKFKAEGNLEGHDFRWGLFRCKHFHSY